jgi:flagellar biosynthesis/type III secretory pathway protein FliH
MIIKKARQKDREENKIEQPLMNNGSVPAENISSGVEEVVQQEPIIQAESPKEPEPVIDLFDIENIDFTQRQERRRGSRRRGYRRIDDRNLVSRAQEESENIKKSAFEEGYRLGLEKATADLDSFKNELSKFMNARKDVFEYIAPDILEISVDIAKKIIKTKRVMFWDLPPARCRKLTIISATV